MGVVVSCCQERVVEALEESRGSRTRKPVPLPLLVWDLGSPGWPRVCRRGLCRAENVEYNVIVPAFHS